MRLDPEEKRAALASGLTRLWAVHEDYEISDDILRPVGTVRRWYFPGAYRSVATDFAQLYDANKREIIDFARRWGKLGHRRLDPTGRLWIQSGGDPVPWIKAHARGIDVALCLKEFLSSPDPDDLREYLRGLVPLSTDVSVPGTPSNQISLHIGEGDSHDDYYFRDWDIDPTGTAGDLLQDIINPNIRLLQNEVAVEDGKVSVITMFPSLAILVYWHLSQIITDSLRIARCAACGHLFEQTHRSQRFCPPPPDEQGRTESLCANRSRQRAHRAKLSG